MKYSFTHDTDVIATRYKSITEELSCLTSSELHQEYHRLAKNEKATTEEDLDRLVAVQEILTQRGETPIVNTSKIKPWHGAVLGAIACFAGMNMFKQPAYYQTQPVPQTNPNVVSVPAGSGATVFNFDND